MLRCHAPLPLGESILPEERLKRRQAVAWQLARSPSVGATHQQFVVAGSEQVVNSASQFGRDLDAVLVALEMHHFAFVQAAC